MSRSAWMPSATGAEGTAVVAGLSALATGRGGSVTAGGASGAGTGNAAGAATCVSTGRLGEGTGLGIVGGGTLTTVRDAGMTAVRETTTVDEDVSSCERTLGVVAGTTVTVRAGIALSIGHRVVASTMMITTATLVIAPTARARD